MERYLVLKPHSLSRYHILLAALAAALLTLAGCKPVPKPNEINMRLNIVATTSMIGDTAQEIGGDAVKVETLMGPGVDPHLYKASEGDRSRLEKADLILYNGLHLEASMGQVLERMEKSGKKVVAVTKDIPKDKLIALKDFPGQYDPHVWMDVSLWNTVSKTIAAAIVDQKPEQKTTINTNLEYFDGKLRMLDQNIRIALGEIPREQRVLITAHDAFEYWGRLYEFDVRGLQGVSTVSETGARDVQELADYIVKLKIPAIFVESSVPHRQVEALQEAVKAKGFEVRIGRPLYSDSIGDYGTTEGSYVGMLRFNAGIIGQELTPPKKDKP